MTTTPTVWLAEFQANNATTAATGSQTKPVTVGLSNGNFFTAWVDDTNNIDSASGTDIIGQLFDPLGNAIGSPTWLNLHSTARRGDQNTIDLAATNDGGFVISIFDAEPGVYFTDLPQVVVGRFDSTVKLVASDIAYRELISSSATVSSPAVDVFSTNAWVVTFNRKDGDTDVLGDIVDANGVTLVDDYDAARNTVDDATNSDVAVLNNGFIVTVYEELDGVNRGIEFRRSNGAGTAIQTVEVENTGSDQTAPRITALVGGGFVVVYKSGGDIRGAIYNAVGTLVTAPFTIAGSAVADENEPDVTALDDGGFFVVWDVETPFTGRILGRRFDATGNTVGNSVTISSNVAEAPSVSTTQDGRILVTWSDINGAGEIKTAILDPRNAIINGTAGDDFITAGVSGSTINGLAGNDILYGYVGEDTLNGGAGNDTLRGGAEKDVIDGGLDNDTIEGGDGNDSLDGGDGTDLLTYQSASAGVTVSLANTSGQNTIGAGFDTIVNFENLTGSAFVDTLSGDGGQNTIRGGDLGDTISGGGGNDTLFGEDGDDTLMGDAGDDLLDGGNGNDILYNQAGADTLIGGTGNDTFLIMESDLNGANRDTYVGGGDNDTMDFSSITLASIPGVQRYIISLLVDGLLGGQTWVEVFSSASEVFNNVENISGSQGSETILGDSGDNILNGNGGDDTIDGGGGSDVINGGAGNDTIFLTAPFAADVSSYNGGTDSDTAILPAGDSGPQVIDIAAGLWGTSTLVNFENIVSNAQNDTITTNSADNDIQALGGKDTVIVSGDGVDVFDGGNGVDTLSYINAPAAVTISLLTNTASGSWAGDDTFLNFENIDGSNIGADTLTGDASANKLVGNGGNDTLSGLGGDDILNGGAGNDTLNGGTGNDTAEFSNRVDANLATGSATDLQNGDVDTLSGIENLTGSLGSDTLTGDAGDNIIHGGTGALAIFGDTLDGGGGNDTVSYAGTSGGVNINFSSIGGTTASGGAANGDLLFNFENIIGSQGQDNLKGDAGENIIEGGGGDDNLFGEAGIDTIVYKNAQFAVDINLQTNVSSEDNTISGFENIIGSDFDDTLTGESGANILTGGLGDDMLNGMLGNDTLDGGDGNDTVSYENASGAVTVDLHTRAAFGADGSDTLIGIENVIGSAFDDTLNGSSFFGDTIEGGDGNDTLVGRGGIDTMIGGAGDDSYFVQQLGDTVVELSGQGRDTVRVYFDNYTLTADVEEGRVVGTANILFGNGFNNLLAGSGGADELHGGGGNDTLTGNGGGDTLFGDAGDDRLIGSAGADTLNGGANNDRLEGNADIDTMNGDDGDDVFFGGGGRDFMTGGLGADRFVFDDADYGGNTFALADRILDFSQLENDSIDLRPTDADTTIANDQAFTFIAEAAFSGTAGELRFIQSGGRTYVQGDTDGDSTSDFMIRLEGLHVLDAGDFLL